MTSTQHSEELWDEVTAEAKARRRMLATLREQQAQIEAQAEELRRLQQDLAWLKHDLAEALHSAIDRAAVVVH